jgi:predicted DNA-binding protein
MSKTLTIRGISDEVYDRFADVARKTHRNAEAFGRFLIEKEATATAETCGDLIAAYDTAPAPDVDLERLEKLQTSRGRRSNRP